MSPSRPIRIALATAALALGLPAMEAAAQAPGEIAVWAPEYTVQLLLPDADGDVSLAADRDALWLATETAVVRFAGGVWSAPTWPDDVSRIFALAPAGGVLWAMGFEGDAWQLAGGRWTARHAPTQADLYAAAALGPSDAWAAGYDYDAQTGVLVHWDAAEARLVSHPDLVGRRLVALVADPEGGLWAGGCAPTEPSSDPVMLHRAPGATDWTAVPLPSATGCIHHLSFAAADRGLAAAGTDLLRWDGTLWRAEGTPPPMAEDGAALEWVRAAHVNVGFGSDGPRDARWAIAGVPTWRGYQDGQPPWVSDGGAWRQATTDDLGLAALRRSADPEPAAAGRGFLDLASDGQRVWSVDGLPQALPAGYLLATLFELADGYATLAHPLLREVTDVATLPGGSLWAAGREGTRPIARDAGGTWTAMPGFRLEDGAQRTGLDVATASAAWLWRPSSVLGPGNGTAGTEAWRWDGTAWHAASTGQRLLQLRAHPDGGGWARGGEGSRLLDHDPDTGTWQALAGAPVPSSAMPDCTTLPRDARLCEMLAAPFDTAHAGEHAIGWLAGDDGTLYQWDGTSFAAAGNARGRVIDLQLLDARAGWAIGIDDAAGGARPRSPHGVLLRLDGGAWREVPLLPALGPRGQVAEDVVWQLMAPVSATEVWLYGQLTTVGRAWPVVVRWTGGAGAPGRENRSATMLWNCRISAMAAAPAPDGGGSDLWLAGYLARGSDTCQLIGGRGINRAQRLWPEPFPYLETGPLSRLRMRTIQDRAFLPGVGGAFRP